jgi:hypothetical protein
MKYALEIDTGPLCTYQVSLGLVQASTFFMGGYTAG